MDVFRGDQRFHAASILAFGLLRAHFVKELQNWIEIDYNQRHRHLTLDHRTPAEFEALTINQPASALSEDPLD